MPAPVARDTTPLNERVAGWQAKALVLLSAVSYLFWLAHSFAIREALAAIRYLAGYGSRH
jgi:hypothetical protein